MYHWRTCPSGILRAATSACNSPQALQVIRTRACEYVYSPHKAAYGTASNQLQSSQGSDRSRTTIGVLQADPSLQQRYLLHSASDATTKTRGFRPTGCRRACSTADAPTEPMVHDVFDTTTGTWQYIVADPTTLEAVIIDPVLDFEPVTRSISTHNADLLLSLVEEKGYKVNRILETHVHADHLTAASYVRNRLDETQGSRPSIGIGKRVRQVQRLFAERYGVLPQEFDVVFDNFFDDDEHFYIGTLRATAMHLPGHTPDHLGYTIGSNVFCGDSLFHVDIGTARCDFPGGSARDLYESANKLLRMPDDVKIWTGHDYPPAERGTAVPWMTVKDHRERNKHLAGVSGDEFVAMRQARDAQLGEPRLLHQSLQINIRAGKLPKQTTQGLRFLHIPFKTNGSNM